MISLSVEDLSVIQAKAYRDFYELGFSDRRRHAQCQTNDHVLKLFLEDITRGIIGYNEGTARHKLKLFADEKPNNLKVVEQELRQTEMRLLRDEDLPRIDAALSTLLKVPHPKESLSAGDIQALKTFAEWKLLREDKHAIDALDEASLERSVAHVLDPILKGNSLSAQLSLQQCRDDMLEHRQELSRALTGPSPEEKVIRKPKPTVQGESILRIDRVVEGLLNAGRAAAA